jgi:CRP-like cAMP-binding protein
VRKVLYVLGQLSDSDSEWLARAGELLRVEAGTELIAEGARVDAMYVLVEGELAVRIRGLGEIARLQAGEIAGELSLVDSRPASATVAALRPSAVLRVERSRLLEKIELDAHFGLRFYRAISTFLADRMRSTVERMGYDAGGSPRLGEEEYGTGEMDEGTLDTVHLAGARFDRIFRALTRGPSADS